MSEPAPSVELVPGSVFAERYRIEGLLGRGGMGVVYRANDLTLGEDIALKLLLCGMQEHTELVARFRQEVRLSRRVTHPNVVRVHDLGEHANLLYMTMELVVGSTLRTVIRKDAPLPVIQAVEIARTMAIALWAAHTAGIIHRDLKPSNVLIESTGRVVLTDFGIARLLNEDSGLTQGIVGSMHYMAPEQVLSGHIDERTDLYALGVVLYEMLLGERPTGPIAQVAARLAHEGARIPPALMRLLTSCLAIEPNSRPDSAAAFVTAIEALEETAAEASVDIEATKISSTKGSGPKSSGRRSFPPSAGAVPSVAVISAPPMTPQVPSNLIPAQKLAVLPFRYRGPSEHEYLADVLTDELVDAISRIRGLLVFGSGATQRFRSERDPVKVGQELATPALIEGTVQAMGDRVRVSVRLVETGTGLQRLTLQYDGRTADIFEFQESVVRRVAEEMRVELVTMAHATAAPSEAVDLYLEARRELRNPDPVSSTQAVALLDRAIELAPDFSPAIAAHAVACTRTWFLHMFSNRDAWADRTSASVSRASTYASHIAESHLGEGMFRANLGDYRAAAAALQRALELAPACAPVHEYVGMLQCEAGHIKKGLQHLDLTTELDPTRPLVWANIARVRFLSGDRKSAFTALQRLESLERPDRFQASVVLRIRDGLWQDDAETLDQYLPVLQASAKTMNNVFFQLFAAALLGDDDALRPLGRFPFELPETISPRFKMGAFQWATEALLRRNQLEMALETVCGAATTVLVDLYWLEKCPLFGPIRNDYAFLEAVRVTRERAAAITPF
ncbi:MAG TPA: protein kinase [Polyangium sp.]|nr:protein kinase [Polyangium sp.]